jgi:two-component system, LytTR family, sensor kinase
MKTGKKGQAAVLWIALLVAIGLLRASNRYLIDIANHVPSLFVPKLIDELTGSLSFGVFLPVLFIVLRRIARMALLPARLLGHLGLFLLLSAAQTSLMLALRLVVFPLAGYAQFATLPTGWRYLMEMPTQLFFYAVIALGLWLFDRYREGQVRELRAAQLESALSDARLEALRLQLNPHFLFNTLNAVSELMYERPQVADEMLSRIGELLRATLSATAQEHRLADEWQLLSLYLDIQRARFGSGLDASVEGDAALDDLHVPFLILQPLVENAIKHGISKLSAGGYIEVTATRQGERVIISVRDNGPEVSLDKPPSPHSLGLRNTRARLTALYGPEQSLTLRQADGGGLIAEVSLPYHTQNDLRIPAVAAQA